MLALSPPENCRPTTSSWLGPIISVISEQRIAPSKNLTLSILWTGGFQQGLLGFSSMEHVECNLDETKKGMVMGLDEIRSRTHFIIPVYINTLLDKDKVDKTTRRNGGL